MPESFQSYQMSDRPPRLEPPFTSSESCTLPFFHPAVVEDEGKSIRPQDELERYLELDLIPSRLDLAYNHLHYAGPPRRARPLHRQRLIGREIIITENISEHMVWHQTKIFLKPLRLYLLHHNFWNNYLCSDSELYSSACGFLLSYTWLVRWESDLQLAHDTNLLPKELNWEAWTKFVISFTGHVDTIHLRQIAQRYQYGELRLSRLNRIYRFTPALFSLRNLFRGFLSPSTWYQEFFRQHFGWFLAVFAVLSVVLSGMQVALATDQLSRDANFHLVSYGFSVFSLVAVAGFLAAIVLTWFIFTLYFYISAKFYHHKIQSVRRKKVDQCHL